MTSPNEKQVLTDPEIMALLPGAVRLPPGWKQTARAIECAVTERIGGMPATEWQDQFHYLAVGLVDDANRGKEARQKAFDALMEHGKVRILPDASEAGAVAWHVVDTAQGKTFITQSAMVAGKAVEGGVKVRPLVYGDSAPSEAPDVTPGESRDIMGREAYDEEADMAEVGRALMKAIETHAPKGWNPNDCPSEIVGDLRNMLDEAKAVPSDAPAQQGIPFAGYDTNFNPGSNPENPQEEPEPAAQGDERAAVDAWVATMREFAHPPNVDEIMAFREGFQVARQPSAAASAELRIGVSATEHGATVCIMQPHADGSATVIYSATHPTGDSMGSAALVDRQKRAQDGADVSEILREIKRICREKPTATNAYGIKSWEKIERLIRVALAAAKPEGGAA
jgi:hypothetical protein